MIRVRGRGNDGVSDRTHKEPELRPTYDHSTLRKPRRTAGCLEWYWCPLSDALIYCITVAVIAVWAVPPPPAPRTLSNQRHPSRTQGRPEKLYFLEPLLKNSRSRSWASWRTLDRSSRSYWARLSGGPLERTGVMQGMSGSPVYIGGKLVGAVAMAFPVLKGTDRRHPADRRDAGGRWDRSSPGCAGSRGESGWLRSC